jgi:hypothetical protein
LSRHQRRQGRLQSCAWPSPYKNPSSLEYGTVAYHIPDGFNFFVRALPLPRQGAMSGGYLASKRCKQSANRPGARRAIWRPPS